MTDKEKILAEIERRLLKIQVSSIRSAEMNGGEAVLNALLSFVDSLPEESVSEVWHDASKERPTKLPIVHIWYHGNRVAGVMTHEDTSLQEELDDINFQPDDKWAYVDDLLNLDNYCNFDTMLDVELPKEIEL